MMKTSAAGLELIRRFEGCRLEAYQDAVGVWTIGWGDTLNVRPGMRITPQEAEERLTGRLAREFEPGVLAALRGAPVSQAQFDAMVSLVWNIGVGAFQHSSVAQRHRAGDYRGAADAFLYWNKAGGRTLLGLERRRAAERALYLSEAAPAAEAPADDRMRAVIEAHELATTALQTRLRDRGYYRGEIDGDFGPASREALRAYLAQGRA